MTSVAPAARAKAATQLVEATIRAAGWAPPPVAAQAWRIRLAATASQV
ncbi:MAG: hypothetical protein ACRDZO_28125 [Egibacteraceae bacterium]